MEITETTKPLASQMNFCRGAKSHITEHENKNRIQSILTKKEK